MAKSASNQPWGERVPRDRWGYVLGAQPCPPPCCPPATSLQPYSWLLSGLLSLRSHPVRALLPVCFFSEGHYLSQGSLSTLFSALPSFLGGEGERVMALESREGTRASRRVEERLSRSLSGGGGKPSFPSPSAGDLRELPRFYK